MASLSQEEASELTGTSPRSGRGVDGLPSVDNGASPLPELTADAAMTDDTSPAPATPAAAPDQTHQPPPPTSGGPAGDAPKDSYIDGSLPREDEGQDHEIMGVANALVDAEQDSAPSTDCTKSVIPGTDDNEYGPEPSSIERQCFLCLETLHFRSERSAATGYKMHVMRCPGGGGELKEALKDTEWATMSEQRSSPAKPVPPLVVQNDTPFYSLEQNPSLTGRDVSVLRKTKLQVQPPDPRPVFGCTWCGPLQKGNAGETLCPLCLPLKKKGWIRIVDVAADKKIYVNDLQKKMPSVRAFLTESTKLVGERLDGMAREEQEALLGKMHAVEVKSAEARPLPPTKRSRPERSRTSQSRTAKESLGETVAEGSSPRKRPPPSPAKNEPRRSAAKSRLPIKKGSSSDKSRKRKATPNARAARPVEKPTTIELPSIAQLLVMKGGLNELLQADVFQVYNTFHGTNATIAAKILMCLGKEELPPSISGERPILRSENEMQQLPGQSSSFVGVYRVANNTATDRKEKARFGAGIPQFVVNCDWSSSIERTQKGHIAPKAATVNGRPLLLRTGIDEEEVAAKLFSFCYRIMYGADALSDVLADQISSKEPPKDNGAAASLKSDRPDQSPLLVASSLG
ncbi:hypothetical protein ACHAXT_003028 [Thalassiosira profunda]